MDEMVGDRLPVTDTATGLDARARLRQLPDQLALGRSALLGAIQIHHMQPTGAGGGKAARHCHRIVPIDGLAVELTLVQADTAALPEVDGRIDDHATARKFSSTRLPTALERSG